MRHAQSLSSWIGTALLTVVWIGCGAVGAEKSSQADGQEELESAGVAPGEDAEPGDGAVQGGEVQVAQQPREAGFFERLLQPEPVPVVVPAGTVLVLRLQDTLSSHETPDGAAFSGHVTQEVSVDGHVAVPAGSIVRGNVLEARAAKKIGGRPILSLSFNELVTPDGQTVGISAHLAQAGRSEVAKDAAIIGGSTIGGAIIGEAIHEGEGGTVGAIAGAIGGTVGALKTKGKPVVLPAGTPLNIALDGAVTVEVRS